MSFFLSLFKLHHHDFPFKMSVNFRVVPDDAPPVPDDYFLHDEINDNDPQQPTREYLECVETQLNIPGKSARKLTDRLQRMLKKYTTSTG